MIKQNTTIFKYWVPIIACFIIIVHVVLVNFYNLTKWKGGGFGMYSEVHYYYNEVYIKNLNLPIDSLKANDINLNDAINHLKRLPNKDNLENMAELVSKYVINDTVIVQVWKPTVDCKKGHYYRELINEIQYIRP